MGDHIIRFQIGDKVKITPFEDIQNAGQIGTITNYNEMAWPYCWTVVFKTSKRPCTYADCELTHVR